MAFTHTNTHRKTLWTYPLKKFILIGGLPATPNGTRFNDTEQIAPKPFSVFRSIDIQLLIIYGKSGFVEPKRADPGSNVSFAEHVSAGKSTLDLKHDARLYSVTDVPAEGLTQRAAYGHGRHLQGPAIRPQYPPKRCRGR